MSEIIHDGGVGAFADRDVGALERRLWRGMCAAIALAVVLCAGLAPWRVTTGVLLGGMLSLFNHHWLSASIKAAISPAKGDAARVGAVRFVLRYFIVAACVAVASRVGAVSLVATLLGLCSFVVALLLEALIQTSFAITHREEI